MRRYLIPSLLLSFAACAGTYTATAAYDTPDLVYADDAGVQVVADYNEPVFYRDNYYWRQHDGVWQRSTYYNRGFVAATPPVVVSRIQSPERYRHYRPAGYAARHQGRR